MNSKKNADGCLCNRYAYVLAVLAALMGVSACSRQVLADNKDKQPIKIENVHWVIRETKYRNNGSSQTGITEYWLKSPVMWRSENEQSLIIDNGRYRWHYFKAMNVYQVRDKGHYPNDKVEFPMKSFLPNWVAEKCRSMTSDVSERKTKAVFKGVEYPALELSVGSYTTKRGTIVGPQSMVVYIDPASGLIKATATWKWDISGTKLVSEEVVEYEYNKSDKPDDFFTFQPPPDAILESRDGK